MLLGNLTVKQIELRTGVDFPEELVNFMDSNHQQEAENIKEGKWHCFDIPFTLVCGDIETAKYIYNHLSPMTKQFKRQMQISIQN